MTRAALILLFSTACGGALSSADQIRDRKQEADERTDAAFAAARARYLADHRLTAIRAELVAADGGEPLAAAGLRTSERIVAVDTDRLAFVHTARCSPCGGCDTSIRHELAAAPDGTVIVLRFVAIDHVEQLRQEGSCAIGCGQWQPPPPARGLVLPTTDPARIRVVEVSFDRYVVDSTCEQPIPAP